MIFRLRSKIATALLVFPYVVNVSTAPGKCVHYRETRPAHTETYAGKPTITTPAQYACDQTDTIQIFSVPVESSRNMYAAVCDSTTVEYCMDEAAALNVGHVVRTRQGK